MSETFTQEQKIPSSTPYPGDFTPDEIALVQADEAWLKQSGQHDNLGSQDYYKMLHSAYEGANGSPVTQIYVGDIRKPGPEPALEEPESPLSGGQYPEGFSDDDKAKVRKSEVWLLASGRQPTHEDYQKMLIDDSFQMYVGDVHKPVATEQKYRSGVMKSLASRLGRLVLR